MVPVLTCLTEQGIRRAQLGDELLQLVAHHGHFLCWRCLCLLQQLLELLLAARRLQGSST